MGAPEWHVAVRLGCRCTARLLRPAQPTPSRARGNQTRGLHCQPTCCAASSITWSRLRSFDEPVPAIDAVSVVETVARFSAFSGVPRPLADGPRPAWNQAAPGSGTLQSPANMEPHAKRQRPHYPANPSTASPRLRPMLRRKRQRRWADAGKLNLAKPVRSVKVEALHERVDGLNLKNGGIWPCASALSAASLASRAAKSVESSCCRRAPIAFLSSRSGALRRLRRWPTRHQAPRCPAEDSISIRIPPAWD